MTLRSRWLCALVALLLTATFAPGQANVQPVTSKQANAEQRTAKALEAARANPLDLRAFLASMPKGADLHVHLSGAVYAESWIRAGVEDHLCVNLSSLSFAKQASGACSSGDVPAEHATRNKISTTPW